MVNSKTDFFNEYFSFVFEENILNFNQHNSDFIVF